MEEDFAARFKAEEAFMVPQSYREDQAKIALRQSAIKIIDSLYSNRGGDVDALIPYTAMTYFDRFVSRNDIPGNNTHLLATSCLTLAWRQRNRDFLLYQFLSGRVLDYSERDVYEMEFDIRIGLEWRLRAVTPCCFLKFFFPLLLIPAGYPQSSSRAVRYLLVKSQFDIAFTEFRPSVMAVSAILIVSKVMFPDQFAHFEQRILNKIEPLRPLKDVIEKCKDKLEALYIIPPFLPPERDITIEIDDPAPTRSKPIPIPGHEPAPRPRKKGTLTKETLMSAYPPGSDLVAAEREYYKMLAAKGPSLAFEDDEDDLMDFGLGWAGLN